MKHSIFTLALISLLFSCKKENSVDLMDHTEVKGRLLDASTGEPIEGGTVYLTQGAGWVIFDSVVTTANGEYAFVYDHVLNSHA
ncbi:MAG: carboxypeptidase regulatory-like domain-containing protein, partial [Flavobacteriales bacterium]